MSAILSRTQCVAILCVSLFPRCTRQISNTAPFCKGNVHACIHFWNKNIALSDMGLVHCGVCATPRSIIATRDERSVWPHYFSTGQDRQCESRKTTFPPNIYFNNKHYLLPLNTPVHHYSDVIMSTMASEITSLAIVYSTFYSDQRKHQSSASLAFVRGTHRDRHKGPVTRKMFPLDDVIMCLYRCVRKIRNCFAAIIYSVPGRLSQKTVASLTKCDFRSNIHMVFHIYLIKTARITPRLHIYTYIWDGKVDVLQNTV